MMVVGLAAISQAMETAFTYQGQLTGADSVPVTETCDFEFAVYDALSDGAQIGTTVTKTGIAVTNGLFTTTLDFGANAFDGAARWLHIGVKCGGEATFTALSPRQALTPTPYALDADLLDGRHADAFTLAGTTWSLIGNAGTDPVANFIGTTDDVTFTVRANNAPVLQFIPNATSPNLIGGYSDNWITPDVFGAVINGGGQNANLNRGTDHFGVIGGGQNNQAGNNDDDLGNAHFTTIAGGWNNTAGGESSAIGGGYNNTANGSYAAIGGGAHNEATGYASTIGGGVDNIAQGDYSFAAGGEHNTADNVYAFIGGGWYNTATGDKSFIGGGGANSAAGSHATISGGGTNTASGPAATVSGGHHNTAGGDSSAISGGHYNTASGPAAAVSGGGGNTATGDYSFVAGRDNTANGASATVGGGYLNTADGDYSFVAGGFYANASHYGEQTHASGQFATAGDAQTSVYVLRREYAMAAGVWLDLFLDGSSALLTIAISRTVTFDILVTGNTAAGESAGYRIAGLIENVGGATALVGTPTVTVLGEDDAAWSVQAIADDTNDALLVQVQGNGETIRWVARVQTAEVSW